MEVNETKFESEVIMSLNDWKKIIKSDLLIEKHRGNTYIGWMGMFIKFNKIGKCFVMDRENKKWLEADPFTFEVKTR